MKVHFRIVVKVMIVIVMVRIIMKIIKQSFADVFQNRCSWEFCKFHRKAPVLELLFNKVAALKACNFIKNTSTQVLSYKICELVKNASSYLGVLPIVVTKVSPIHLQELINNFAVCKHCSRTLLLVEDVTSSHDFGN